MGSSVEYAKPRAEGLSSGEKPALRYAMLSVYYGSLGRELESRGAPAMLLPMGVRPLDLDDAVEEIAGRWPDRLRDAAWTVVRSVAPPRSLRAGGQRYPEALARALADVPGKSLDLRGLDELRWKYRSAAALLAAALVAAVQDRSADFQRLRGAIPPAGDEFSISLRRMLGRSPSDVLDDLSDPVAMKRLRRLASEVGLDLYEYVGDFADAAAFLNWWEPEPRSMTVYPAACAIRQDSSTLITTVTVTALVSCCDFATMARSVDPQCWQCSSDVVTGTRYVEGVYDLTPAQIVSPGKGLADGESRLLEEAVSVSWGFDENQVGSFHNVLRIDPFLVDEHNGTIDVGFSLARSIDSTILWDQRGGGILIDQGYMKVRRISEQSWRVTSRKVLKFSDRSPNASGPGWLDFGQMLNYLAPAALCWWLESEMDSAADQIYSDPARLQACLDHH